MAKSSPIHYYYTYKGLDNSLQKAIFSISQNHVLLLFYVKIPVYVISAISREITLKLVSFHSKSQKKGKIVILEFHFWRKHWHRKSCSLSIYANFDHYPSLVKNTYLQKSRPFWKSKFWFGIPCSTFIVIKDLNSFHTTYGSDTILM